MQTGDENQSLPIQGEKESEPVTEEHSNAGEVANADDVFLPLFNPSKTEHLQLASFPAYHKPEKKPSISSICFRTFSKANTLTSNKVDEEDPNASREKFVITTEEMKGVDPHVLKRTHTAAQRYSLRATPSKVLDKVAKLKKDGKNPELLRYHVKLAFASVGMVFGDVGTSPLYTFTSIFAGRLNPQKEDVLGALSLIIWTLILIVAIKYATFMLMASDRGEGGSFALFSLLSRSLPHRIKNTCTLGWVTFVFEIMACIGVSAVLSDGILTPSISVLAAVEGLEVAAHVSTNVVVGVAIAIVVILFLIQQLGTSRVAFMFSPFMTVWFVSLFAIGVYNIIQAPEVLEAFSPVVGAAFFVRHGFGAWASLGSVFLCVTGAEATYADMGHFTGRAIRLSALLIVVPSLLATYCGQAARLIQDPSLVLNTFFFTLPTPVFYPMLILSFCAAVTSSQAIISATFSLISQAIRLGMFPKLTLKHTDNKHIGQIYIPEVNYFYMITVICVIIAYKSPIALGNAYGIAVSAAMLIDSAFYACVIYLKFNRHWIFSLMFFAIFGLIDAAFLSSNLLKFPLGGWFAVVLTSIISTFLIFWHWGRRRMLSTRKHLFTDTFENFFQPDNPVMRDVTVMKHGLCICYSSSADCVAPAYLHYLNCVRCLPRFTVFVHIRSMRQAFVERDIVVETVPCGIPELKVYRCIIDNGYKQASPHAEFLAQAILRRLAPNAHYFYLVSQDHVSFPPDSVFIHRFFVRCFELILGISRTENKDLDFPSERCLEIGITIPIPRKELKQ